MKKTILLIFVVAMLSLVSSHASNAQDNKKIAQTGMKFLNVGAGAEATAMGEAITSVEGSSISMFYNPAGMARLAGTVDITVGQTEWIAEINHKFATIALRPFDGDYGVIGLTLQFVDYGILQATIRDNSAKGYRDLGTFSPSASAIGIGYSRALSTKFSIGGNVKFARQNLGTSILGVDDNWNTTSSVSTVGNVVVFDLGMLYRTGFKSLNFGVTIRNFSREIQYEKESFQLPLIFKLGVSMNVLDLFEIKQEEQSFLLSVDATHPRDYPEQVNVGGQYLFMNLLALRAGYMFNNDEYGFTGGLGVQTKLRDFTIGFDYSYTPFGVFDKVQRVSLHFTGL